MGFPIKKRINCADHGDSELAPCGLDLLSAAAIDARLGSVARPEKPAPSSSLGPPQAQGTTDPSSTRKASGDGGEEPSAAPEAVPSQSAASSGKTRSRPFPAVLRDILSDPAHASAASWLPHGRSFAVHDTHEFSSEVLPKYFRRVVFRSFARKLNRWGFRSIRKSVSGFQVTFEHPLFRRDEPELSEGMKCRSAPATTKSQAAVAAGQARSASQTQAILTHPVPLRVQAPSQSVPLQTFIHTHPVPLQVRAPSQSVPLPTAPIQTHARTQRQVISPSFSAAGAAPPVPGTAAAPFAAAPAPRRNPYDRPFPAAAPLLWPRGRESAVARAPQRPREEEGLLARLRDELVLRELRRRAREREGEILRFLRGTPASASDAATWCVAERLCRQMLEQQRQRGHGGY